MRLRSDGRVGLVFTKAFGFKKPPVEDPESRPDGLESGISGFVEEFVLPLERKILPKPQPLKINEIFKRLSIPRNFQADFPPNSFPILTEPRVNYRS